MTIQQAMDISRGSLNNYQQALTVVSQNLANMNVNGYIKLRADFTTNPTYSYGNNLYSSIKGLNGATLSSITSYANSAASQSARDANSQAQYYGTMNVLMGQLGNISNELTGDGLQASYEKFFSMAQNLSTNPTDLSARKLYVQSAQDVASKFNSIAKSLDNMQEELVGNWQAPSSIKNSDVYMGIQDFNAGLGQVAELNKQILLSGGGENANGLINERENLLNQLSSYTDINIVQKEDGTVDVFSGNTNLVKGGVQKAKLDAITGDANTPAIIQVKTMDDKLLNANANDQISGGMLGGILDMVNESPSGTITINKMREEVNAMASAFATEVNNNQMFVDGDTRAMAMGVDPITGENILIPATEPIFNITNPITAGSISINQNIVDDPKLVAAARVDTTQPDWQNNVGNADNMVATAQLRNKKTMSSTGGANDSTFEGFLTYFNGNVGLQQKDIAAKAKTTGTLNESASLNLKSLTGVNLDEELSDMIKFQRAYEASARMFNTANEIYQLLVNLGR